MDKAHLIQDLAGLLLNDQRQDFINSANSNYPFINRLAHKRQYSKYQMCRVFLRDHFIDRYTGKKLLFPGLIKILSVEFPDIFKQHKNWKMAETHMIYWELFPTIDHVIPIALGGQDIESNWVTTSMISNSAKLNWTIEELGWTLHVNNGHETWDGLVSLFLDLTKKNPDYEKVDYIRSWKAGLIRALNEER